MALHRLQKGIMIRGFPVSALRSEARKGRLELILVANRHYVSDEAIDAMVKRCSELKTQDSKPRSVRAAQSITTSVTDRRESALVYLKATARPRSCGSPNT